jgi:high-affinity nickel-transport protein
VTIVEAVKRSSAKLSSRERASLAGMAAFILFLFVAGSLLLAAAVPQHYRVSRTEVFGFGTGVLALTLGMRHAFDADHIASIDNTTRKMMAEGRRPLSVGFFFSLGHASVVFVLTILLSLGMRSLNIQVSNANSGLHQVTSLLGTLVSGSFLYLIAALNLLVLLGITRSFRAMRTGRYDEAELEEMLNKRGFMNRFLGSFAKRVDEPWKMYPLGILFGLGFDTATEIGLLVLSGSAIVGGLPLWAVLALPLLFAAGMCLLDTIDGCFMNFAYEWAFAQPVRKLYYNLVITVLSIAVAFLIGSAELLSLISTRLNLHGSFWDSVGSFNLNHAGFAIAALFVFTWLVALWVWRVGNFEDRYGVDHGALPLADS